MDIRSGEMLMRQLREQLGDNQFFHLTDRMKKERVRPDRDKREFVPWKDLRKMAKRQHWICGICNDPENRMADDRKYTVLDHIDPQRIDFNHPDNLQAAHKSCNAAKSAKNQTEVSKMRQLEQYKEKA